jgi:hypothetical protein
MKSSEPGVWILIVERNILKIHDHVCDDREQFDGAAGGLFNFAPHKS